MENTQKKWFVLRDLKRRNSLSPAYIELGQEGYEVFTPLKWEIAVKAGRRIRR